MRLTREKALSTCALEWPSTRYLYGGPHLEYHIMRMVTRITITFNEHEDDDDMMMPVLTMTVLFPRHISLQRLMMKMMMIMIRSSRRMNRD